jgi:tRNA-binding EMAP/Myf-like protein
MWRRGIKSLVLLHCAAVEAAPAAAAPAADPATQQPTAAAAAGEPSPVTAMDIRIGQIKSIEKHPDADSLYVEQVRECVC